MDLKKLGWAAAALVLLATAAGLLRSCGRGPAASRESGSSPAADIVSAPKKRGAQKKTAALRKERLIAPRLLNLDELQANIRKYYPEAEHAAGKEGHVMMSLVVGTDGAVSGVRVETSGGADFDEAARKAVLAMRFSPALKAGKPVAVEITEGVDFQFDGK